MYVSEIRSWLFYNLGEISYMNKGYDQRKYKATWFQIAHRTKGHQTCNVQLFGNYITWCYLRANYYGNLYQALTLFKVELIQTRYNKFLMDVQ